MRGVVHLFPHTSYGLMCNSAERQVCSCTSLVDWLFKIDVWFVVRNVNFDSCKSLFLGAFAEWRRATVNFVMSACLSVCQHVNNLAPAGQVVMRIDIWGCFENLPINLPFIVIWEYDGHFAWTVYVYDSTSILLKPFLEWDFFSDKSCVENYKTHFLFSINYLRKSCRSFMR
jgi:hypothetical protein